MRNTSGKQAENERQWKNREHEPKQQIFLWAYTTFPP